MTNFIKVVDYSDNECCSEQYETKTRCIYIFGFKIFTIKYFKDEIDRLSNA